MEEFLNKTRLILLIFMLLGTLFIAGIAHSGMYDHQGMEVSAGGFSNDVFGAKDNNYDFNWFQLSLFNRHDIDEDWNIVIYGNLGYLHWSANYDDPDQDSFEIGAQLVLYRHIYKGLSLGLGGGLSTLTKTNNLPDLGNSGLYGTITGRLKVEVSKSYGVEFAGDHISDTLQDGDSGDAGKNVFSLKVYYMFN